MWRGRQLAGRLARLRLKLERGGLNGGKTASGGVGAIAERIALDALTPNGFVCASHLRSCPAPLRPPLPPLIREIT